MTKKEKVKIVDKLPDNKTSIFLMPLVDIHRNNPYLLGAYIGDLQDGLHANTVSIIMKWNGSLAYSKMERMIHDRKGYRGEQSLADDQVMRYILEIPSKLKPNFIRFLKGEYSQFCSIGKSQVMKARDKDGDVYKVLYRLESRRLKMNEDLHINIIKGQELLSSPEVKRDELFNPNKLIQD